MATKAELQVQVTHLTAALASANERYERLLISSSEYRETPKASLPCDDLPTRRQVMAAAKAQAMATGRTVLVA